MVELIQKGKACFFLISLDDVFSTEGYQTNLSILPKIRYGNIGKYLIEDVELKRQLSTEKPIV